MNPEALLALISDLYAQLTAAHARIRELEEQQQQQQKRGDR